MSDDHSPTPISPTSLDHVALWVSRPQALAAALCEGLGMHVIERTDTFTLVGVDARLGKLTLFAADGPREAGALERIALRVDDVDHVIERLPPSLRVLEREPGEATLAAPEGVRLGLVPSSAGQVAFDLDHVVLRVGDPTSAARRLEQMGFTNSGGRLVIGDRHVRLIHDDPGRRDRPLLHHLAVLVDSVDDCLASAVDRGIEVDEIKDAANTYAAFVWGPERIKLEYVEHKPGFALV